ncbi:MAG: VCBS repeat-containing protein [Methylocella sp.]
MVGAPIIGRSPHPLDGTGGISVLSESSRSTARLLFAAMMIIASSGPLAHAQQTKPAIVGIPPFSDCGLSSLPANPEISHEANPKASVPKWSCAPPYQIPVFAPPVDDGVALSTLLEASGVSSLVNVGWMGATAGHFCDATLRQIAVITNVGNSSLALLGGPAPVYLGGTESGVFLPSNKDQHNNTVSQWRGAAAGRFNLKSAYDDIVAVRQVGVAGAPDLVIGSATADCTGSNLIASGAIGTTANSDWVGVAVGAFDSSHRQLIAMLRTGGGQKGTQLVLVDPNSRPLRILARQDLDANVSKPSAWKGLAAGRLDGGTVDELVAVREVGDGHSATVLVYKWGADNQFDLVAQTGFGNTNNSDWVGVAVGDFNADGRASIALLKNKHSDFSIFALPAGTSNGVRELVKVTSDDLDSVSGQNWTSLVATDWLAGDQGADELIALRTVDGTHYRENVLVYGNVFHVLAKRSALEGTKAQYDQLSGSGSPDYQIGLPALVSGPQPQPSPNIAQLKQVLRDTHTNTFVWQLIQPYDYTNLVAFLDATKDFGVDGKQLRVWANIIEPHATGSGDCSSPENTPQFTSWNATDYFARDVFYHESLCNDMAAWASVLGRLAQDYPHLVGLAIDDFIFDIQLGSSGHFTPDLIAQMESNLRSQAPWMSLIPTVYYPPLMHDHPRWMDLPLALDTMLFYFKNEKQGTGPCAPSDCLMPDGSRPQPNACLAGVGPSTAAGLPLQPTGECANKTVPNASGEFEDVFKLLVPGRKLLGGVYFTGHSEFGEPHPAYDFQLTGQILNDSRFYGALAYVLQQLPPGETCPSQVPDTYPFKYCIVRRVFGAHP